MSKSTGGLFGRILFWMTVLIGFAGHPPWRCIGWPHCPTSRGWRNITRNSGDGSPGSDQGTRPSAAHQIRLGSPCPGFRPRSNVLSSRLKTPPFSHEGFDWEGIRTRRSTIWRSAEFKRGAVPSRSSWRKISTCHPNGLCCGKPGALITAPGTPSDEKADSRTVFECRRMGPGRLWAEAAARAISESPPRISRSREGQPCWPRFFPSPRRYDPIRHRLSHSTATHRSGWLEGNGRKAASINRLLRKVSKSSPWSNTIHSSRATPALCGFSDRRVVALSKIADSWT